MQFCSYRTLRPYSAPFDRLYIGSDEVNECRLRTNGLVLVQPMNSRQCCRPMEGKGQFLLTRCHGPPTDWSCVCVLRVARQRIEQAAVKISSQLNIRRRRKEIAPQAFTNNDEGIINFSKQKQSRKTPKLGAARRRLIYQMHRTLPASLSALSL
jgi:hypothetical protein